MTNKYRLEVFSTCANEYLTPSLQTELNNNCNPNKWLLAVELPLLVTESIAYSVLPPG